MRTAKPSNLSISAAMRSIFGTLRCFCDFTQIALRHSTQLPAGEDPCSDRGGATRLASFADASGDQSLRASASRMLGLALAGDGWLAALHVLGRLRPDGVSAVRDRLTVGPDQG